MRLAIMQPYFFPYIGYFSLINAVDMWIAFDIPQYIRKGWVNRNRVLKQGGGWKYISIPISKCPRETSINEVTIKDPEGWRSNLLRNLDVYKLRKAPYYDRVIELLGDSSDFSSSRLSETLIPEIQRINGFIGISTPINVLSKMELNIGTVSHAGEWALRICKALNAKTYINPSSGKDLFDSEQFKNSGIELKFIDQNPFTYYQGRGHLHEPNLSIIDVMMWNSKSDIKTMLSSARIRS